MRLTNKIVNETITETIGEEALDIVEFLKIYKQNVGYFNSIYIPQPISYFLCHLWEKYSQWSEGQLPMAFNRRLWSSYWKGNCYVLIPEQ